MGVRNNNNITVAFSPVEQCLEMLNYDLIVLLRGYLPILNISSARPQHSHDTTSAMIPDYGMNLKLEGLFLRPLYAVTARENKSAMRPTAIAPKDIGM